MPLAGANLAIHLPTILSRMPLAEANLIIHLPTILSRMPLPETNLVNTLDLFTVNMTFIVITFTRKNFKLCKCKEEGKSRNCSTCLVTSPNRRFNHVIENVIENPYSFITYMLLSMHVHFLIITYIHILCIFLELISQRASVCTTQFLHTHTHTHTIFT